MRLNRSLLLAWLLVLLSSCGFEVPDSDLQADLVTEGLREERGLPEEPVLERVTLGELHFDVYTAGPRDGEVVMLLHGFPESAFEWRHQIPRLAAAGYRVLAPNMRGYSPGARPARVEDYAFLNFVLDTVGIADALGAWRFHLVGHDEGGRVAWATGQFFGLRLKSLTAISTPHPGAFAAQLADPASCQSMASAGYDDLLEPDAAEKLLRGDPPLLLDVWAGLGPDAEAEYTRLLGTPDALEHAIAPWRANFIDGQPQGALPLPVLVPTLYIWGEMDPFNCGDGEPMSRRLSWGPYRFVSLPEVGHFVPEQAPDRFYDELIRHLRRYRF